MSTSVYVYRPEYVQFYSRTRLYILPVFHFNRCLTTEHSETAAHFYGNFDTDIQIYVS
jgi:hypothetical protein